MTGRKGRHAPRSRNGCSTCRIRKVKCDEARPVCKECARTGLGCDWPAPGDRVSRRRGEAAAGARTGTGAGASNGPARKKGSREIKAALLPLAPAIDNCHDVRCANSLTLSREDRELLARFPASTVYYQFASRGCSPIDYVSLHIAPSSTMVTHMILALAGEETWRRRKYSGRAAASDPGMDRGLFHYNAAVKELQVRLLGSIETWNNSKRLDEVIVTLFFMIQLEYRSSANLEKARMHFNGLTSLIGAYIRSFSDTKTKSGHDAVAAGPVRLPPLSSRLLLWIMYMDSGGTCTGFNDSILEQLCDPGNPALSLNQVFDDGRCEFPKLWGASYPSSFRQDDQATLRPFQFAHTLFLTRSRIWRARSVDASAARMEAEYAKFMDILLSLRDSYADITDAIVAVPSTDGASHSLHINAKLVLNFWACVLFCRRWLRPLTAATEPIHSYAVAAIAQCARAEQRWESRRVIRLVWPLFMAAIETADRVDRDWLLGQLRSIRDASAECERSCDIAHRITTVQGQSASVSGVPRVADLADYIPAP